MRISFILVKSGTMGLLEIGLCSQFRYFFSLHFLHIIPLITCSHNEKVLLAPCHIHALVAISLACPLVFWSPGPRLESGGFLAIRECPPLFSELSCRHHYSEQGNWIQLRVTALRINWSLKLLYISHVTFLLYLMTMIKNTAFFERPKLS